MKMAFGIFARDLKVLLRNPIAALVVGALLILPGLYAWYCIVANWDPYANTGNVPIAIVNNDKGAESELTGKLDIGEQLVSKLKSNDAIDWRFYDNEEEALEDTRYSLCYATIVLPDDLSERIVGIFEGSKDPPTIYYYPNEKYNAVATKVCDSAAQTLVRQINQHFSSTVNETLLKKVQGVADQAEARADGVNSSALADIKSVQKDVAAVTAALDDAADSMVNWREAVAGSQDALAGAETQLPAVEGALARGSGDLDKLRRKTDQFSGVFAGALIDTGAALANLSGTANATLGKANADVIAIAGAVDGLIARVEAIVDDLLVSSETKGVRKRLDASLEQLRGLSFGIALATDEARSATKRVNANVKALAKKTNRASSTFTGSVMPGLSAGTSDLVASLSELSGAIGQFEPQVVELKSVLAQTDSVLVRAGTSVADAKVLLAEVSRNLKKTVDDLTAIGSALEIEELSKLLDIDPDNLGTFVSTPVQMTTEKIYPVSNYGTAVAPFYTNLALWIGCFILASLIKLEVDRTGFERATSAQRYFGRWLLFAILSLLQSQVICGVDILLGIDCANPGLFMLAGAVCSFAYMNLIFALVITFRNIGKTFCILLLIMQVPGSSGMYPIEMMPGFFQAIHPLLPFTYGIDAMREALCGLFGMRYAHDLCMLALLVPVAFVLGLVVRPFMLNFTKMFDTEMNKTGFFAGEEYGQGSSSERLMSLMRTIAASDEHRDKIEERAWRFNRSYPRLRRIGTVAVLAIPFAFLLFVLPFNLVLDLSVDVKLGAFFFMIVVLVVLFFALILLEYAHNRIREETRLLGSTLMGDAMPANADEPPEVVVPVAVGRKSSGVIRDIFTTDMRLGFQSAIGVVVIALLVITPSMYAWFNIAGSWDPYGKTDGLRVAVANSDAGYKGELVPVKVNVGDTVVSQLRGNESFDWTFVGADEAVSGVESGEFYASIVIPEDFSQNMMTYLTSDADYPTVLYYTNEKENPIAPIITQKGADSIQESIRAAFTERIDEVGLSIASDLLEYVTQPRVSGYALKMAGHLDDATHDMKTGSTELKSLSDLVATVSGVVVTTGSVIDGISGAADSAKRALGSAENGVSGASKAFSKAADVVEGLFSGSGKGVDDVQADADMALALLQAGAKRAPSVLGDIADELESWSETLGELTGSPKEDDTIASSLKKLAKAVRKAANNSAGTAGSIKQSRKELASLVKQAQKSVAKARAFFGKNVKSSVGDLKSTMATVSSSAHSIDAGLENALAGLSGSTDGLSGQLTSLARGLNKAGAKIGKASASIESAKARLQEALQSGDVDLMKSVLIGSDTTFLAERLAQPISLERQPVYSVRNYGSSMAPFYTVLSLWVGALVMISTMRVHIVEERLEELRRRYKKVRPRHEFFGRYGIFGFISLLQSALVLLGDLLFLGIQCVNPVLFFIFGLFVGQVFCLIVYTLTELFGDVGKALCVILLIMQVAASGGTFPAEMLDPLLFNIVPFLPFYHAMSLLQECVAGVTLFAAAMYVAALLVAVGVMLLVGVVVRKPFRRMSDFFEAQLEKTGYM